MSEERPWLSLLKFRSPKFWFSVTLESLSISPAWVLVVPPIIDISCYFQIVEEKEKMMPPEMKDGEVGSGVTAVGDDCRATGRSGLGPALSGYC